MNTVKRKRYEMNLTEGPVLKTLLIFTVPVVFTNFLQQLYVTLGSIIVGNFAGKEALAAIGATTSLTNIMLYFFIGLSVGATVVCAKYYGAGNREMLDKAIHTSIMTAITSGVLLALMGVFLSKPLLTLLGTPKNVIGQSTAYMVVFFLGSPFSMLYNFGSGILRAGGDTKRPFYILSLSGLVNISVSLLCVNVFKMGGIGAALGTVASQIFSAFFVVRILMKSERVFNLRIKDIRFHKEPFVNIIKVGVPSGINSMLFSLANLFLQSNINTYQDAYIAGSSAGTSVENFLFLSMNAIEQAVVSCVGQNYGAKKYKRIDKIFGTALLFGTVITVTLCLIILWKTEFLLSLFNKDPEVIKAGVIRLDIVCKTCLLYLPNVLIPGALKGMERSTLPTVLNIIFICATRVLWMLFVYPKYPSFAMIFMCFPLSWLLATIAQFIAYFAVRISINKNLKKSNILEV